MTYNRKEIIQFLRNGQNQKAIESLYTCYPSIQKFIKNNGGNEADAKDMFQDALIILYKNAQNPEFNLSCTPLTYIFSVVRFLWKDALKKKNREIATEDSNINRNEFIENDIDYYSANRKKINHVLKFIGEKCKAILKAYYYEKLSMNEIADKFEFSSVNSAKTQKYKCLEKAKKTASNQKVSKIPEL